MQFMQSIHRRRMSQNKVVVCLITLVFISFTVCYAKLSFNNVNCTSLDKDFCDFEYCYLKAVNRTYQFMSLKVLLYRVPVTNITIRFALLKRANGYKPFLYDMTFDGCAYLKGRSNPVVKFIFELFKRYSNMNHTCPYDHDIIVEKLSNNWIDNSFTTKLPMPEGDYALSSTWMAYNIPRAVVIVYVKLF